MNPPSAHHADEGSEILERQLEGLFSDISPPDSTTAEGQRRHPHRRGPILAPNPQLKPLAARPNNATGGARSVPSHGPGWVRRYAAPLTGLTLFCVFAAFFVIRFGPIAYSGAFALGSETSATLPSRPDAVLVKGVQRALTPTPVGLNVAPGTPNVTERSSNAGGSSSLEISTDAPKVTVVQKLTVPPTDSAGAIPGPNPSSTPTPAPVTPSPMIPTPTATLKPVEGVFLATATPVPPSWMGLGTIPTPVPRLQMPDGAINIVLLGSDQRPYESRWRTDVIIVVSVNPSLPSVSMVSIPRDTWLYIPNWTYQRINVADAHGDEVGYPGGGPGLVKATIEYNLGIHVDYFARVDFAGLIKIVDALNGIDVLLDCPVEDGFPDDPISEDPSVVTQISYPEPGVYHLDGKHSLWLARSRKTTSEFARSRRQHRILQGIWAKANGLGIIPRLPDLWEELLEAVETDLSLDDVVWLAAVGRQLDTAQIHSGFIDGQYLSAWVSPGGGNVLLPHTEGIIKDLEPLFNPYPLKASQGFNRIQVWNGSGREGWGMLAADRLARNGFEVVEIKAIESDYDKTVILDFTSGTKGSPLPLLERLFDAEIAHAPAESVNTGAGEISFTLIVGADYQPCEWPTPAQWGPTPTPSPFEG